jgi:polyferredoxin
MGIKTMSPTLLLLRKIFFALTVGISFYTVMLFAKPILERIFSRKYDNDAYFWIGVFLAIIFGILAGLLI